LCIVLTVVLVILVVVLVFLIHARDALMVYHGGSLVGQSITIRKAFIRSSGCFGSAARISKQSQVDRFTISSITVHALVILLIVVVVVAVVVIVVVAVVVIVAVLVFKFC
jgi:hypothetical protein